MSDEAPKVNALKVWIVASREEQRLMPKCYLAHYPELKLTATTVSMTRETFETIKANCGRYDGTLPTGRFCGKMFMRGRFLCWYGIHRSRPMEFVQLNFREINILDE